MRRFVCGEAKRPAGLAMEGLRRPTKSRQGAMPNSAKPTQVGSSTRRLSCIARQRHLILSILSILSHSTPHPQPPHLYKCGGSHAANNEGPRSELHFAAIEPCSAKTSAARSRQPFIPASSISSRCVCNTGYRHNKIERCAAKLRTVTKQLTPIYALRFP